jgi:hypothetical protein
MVLGDLGVQWGASTSTSTIAIASAFALNGSIFYSNRDEQPSARHNYLAKIGKDQRTHSLLGKWRHSAPEPGRMGSLHPMHSTLTHQCYRYHSFVGSPNIQIKREWERIYIFDAQNHFTYGYEDDQGTKNADAASDSDSQNAANDRSLSG